MGYVFISYSHNDQEYARELAKELHQRGLDVWFDKHISYGEQWWKAIEKAIIKCAAFVVIMTPDSENSEWVEREILLAQREKKTILPLLLTGTPFSLLITTQHVDVREGNLPDNSFYEKLKSLLTNTSSGSYRGNISPHLLQPSVLKESRSTLNPTHTSKPGNSPISESEKFALSERRKIIISALSILIILPAIILFVLVFRNEKGDNQSSNRTQEMLVVETLDKQETSTLSITEVTTTLDTSSLTTDTATAISTQTPISTSTITLFPTTMTPPTATETATFTPTSSDTYTPTSSATPTPTFTETTTPSPTHTVTPTPTFSPSGQCNFNAQSVQKNSDWTIRVLGVDQGIDMAVVPPGYFIMGTTTGEGNEKPTSTQCIEDYFWIDVHEVTNNQYTVCVMDGVCDAPTGNVFYTDPLYANHPVVNVTWQMAADYCAWRDVRLPTEKEWEYAARGPDNLVYPGRGGASLDLSSDGTVDVFADTRDISWVGARFMNSNVQEWVSSSYQSDSYDETDGRETPSDEMIIRGAAWDATSDQRRTTVRDFFPSEHGSLKIGFRCARDFN